MKEDFDNIHMKMKHDFSNIHINMKHGVNVKSIGLL